MKKVAFISQPEYFRFIYENNLDGLFETREFPFHFDMDASQCKDIVNFDADYNVFFRGEYFPEEILNQLRGVKIALSSEPFPRKIANRWEYSVDSLKRYIAFRHIRLKRFDYVFHYDAASLDLFKADGMEISGEFAFPVAMQTYAPETFLENSMDKKKWDFFFIGRSTHHREQFFGFLKHNFNFLHIAHGIWGASLVKYIHKSTICLNVHAENEISWEPRMQMMLASGAFVMSEKITPNPYLLPGRDYIEFSDKDDLWRKSDFYLKHPWEREKIIHNARESIRKYFDARLKFTELFGLIESGKLPIFKSSNHGHILFFCVSYVLNIWEKIKRII